MSSSTLFIFFLSSLLHCCFINHLQTLVFCLIIPTRYVLGKIESAWYVVVFLIRSCQNLGHEISPWYCRIQNDRPGLGLDLGDVVAAVVAVAAVELAVGPRNSKLHEIQKIQERLNVGSKNECHTCIFCCFVCGGHMYASLTISMTSIRSSFR